MLEATYCRRRQMRLMQRMAEKNLGAICVGQRRHVYYLSGHWTQWTQRSAAIVFFGWAGLADVRTGAG